MALVQAKAFRPDSDGRKPDIARYSSLGRVESGPCGSTHGVCILSNHEGWILGVLGGLTWEDAS